MKSFELSNGYELPIVKGFREQIKSTWRNAYRDFEFDSIPIEKTHKLKHDIKNASLFLSKYDISLKDKKIMDAGCYLGIQCFGAMELGAKEAVGIDIPEYYVNQATNKDVNASKVLEQRRNEIRSQHPDLDQSKINFHDLSVFEMDFKDEFDIIFSWETFEHILNPKEALKRIYKALKPGGISFHVYNPFFCVSGGHSMCTLDYPFAHILMTNEDFKKYTQEIIPENPPKKYSELSYNFFTKNLNRMTQQDLRNYINETNFELLDFITMPDMNVLNYLDSSILNASKQLYPNLTLNDLMSGYVYFIIRKP
jgi:2-polyprenyl-3-methyl-5-hydroxy-6-metoxy-1,4-benzoquinol methylase